MPRRLFIAALLAAAPLAARAASVDLALGTTATDVLPSNAGRYHLMIYNTDYATPAGGSGIAMWCRFGTAAASPAAPHALGSWPVLAGSAYDSGIGNPIAKDAVNCVAESGTPILHAEQY